MDTNARYLLYAFMTTTGTTMSELNAAEGQKADRSNKLFVPATGITREELISSNKSQITQISRYNERYQIAKLNFGILKTNEPFDICPFPESQVLVMPLDKEFNTKTNSYTWRGKYLRATEQEETHGIEGLGGKIRLSIWPMDFAEKGKSAYPVLFGRIEDPYSKTIYKHEVLHNNPEYYVILEVDKEKRVMQAPNNSNSYIRKGHVLLADVLKDRNREELN